MLFRYTSRNRLYHHTDGEGGSPADPPEHTDEPAEPGMGESEVVDDKKEGEANPAEQKKEDSGDKEPATPPAENEGATPKGTQGTSEELAQTGAEAEAETEKTGDEEGVPGVNRASEGG